MSDITDNIDTLRDQVQALEMELANVQEANSEWHELMNEHDVQHIQKLVRFDNDFDVEDVEGVLSSYDLDDLKDAYDKIENYGEPQELAERVEELENAERKIEEYGDPETMAAELEELKEELQDAANNAADDSVSRDVYEEDRATLEQRNEELINLRADLAEKDNYIVVLKTEVARLDSELVRISDELEKTYGSVPYKALYDSVEQELSAAKVNLAALRLAYRMLLNEYFANVSGFDDVPSSKPDDYNNQGE